METEARRNQSNEFTEAAGIGTVGTADTEAVNTGAADSGITNDQRNDTVLMGLDFDGDDGDYGLDFTYTSLAPDALAWASNANALTPDTNAAPYSEQDSNGVNAAQYSNQNANDAIDSLLKEFTANNSKTKESLNSALAEEMEDAFSTDADEEMIEDTINILKAKGFRKGR